MRRGGLIRAQGRVRVARPAEQVFDFVADLHDEPRFNPDASEVVKVTEGEIGLGTTYTEKVRSLGRLEVRIDEYERPTRLGFDARGARAHVLVRFRFVGEDGSTEILAMIELRLRGPLRPLTPLLRPIVRRMYERQRGPLLKRALESGA